MPKLAMVELAYLVDMPGIADRLKVKQATVRKWKQRHKDFPKPRRELAIGELYYWPDIKAWANKPRPPHRPKKGR